MLSFKVSGIVDPSWWGAKNPCHLPASGISNAPEDCLAGFVWRSGQAAQDVRIVDAGMVGMRGWVSVALCSCRFHAEGGRR